MDEAVVCPGCGADANVAHESTTNTTGKPKLMPKINKLWIILGAVALVLGIIAAILFVPRNLKMDSFKKTNVVTAIIQYGLPESTFNDPESGVILRYGDKVDFYGITAFHFAVYPEEDRVVFFFNKDDGYDVYKKIDRYCELENNLGSFDIFEYKNLEITTRDYDGSYVSIEIN